MFTVSADGWIEDTRTGEKYLVLDTNTLSHDDNLDKCLQHGGILPEPRSQEENEFLNSLNSDLFVLGMSDRDTEDTWVWDSDVTPVVWQNWQSDDPGGGPGENCAVMLRNYGNSGALWGDVACLSHVYMDAKDKQLICQKSKGKLDCLVFFSIFA